MNNQDQKLKKVQTPNNKIKNILIFISLFISWYLLTALSLSIYLKIPLLTFNIYSIFNLKLKTDGFEENKGFQLFVLIFFLFLIYIMR